MIKRNKPTPTSRPSPNTINTKPSNGEKNKDTAQNTPADNRKKFSKKGSSSK